jgi:hypothetical protein
MTFQELGLRVKKQIFPGTYDDVPEEMVAHAFLEKYPQYWDLVSPASRDIYDLMKRDNRPSYTFAGFVSDRQRAEDEAAISGSLAQQAEHLHDMELRMAAVNAGMTLTDYSTAQLEAFRHRLNGAAQRFQTDETIRLRQAEAEISIEQKRRERRNEIDLDYRENLKVQDIARREAALEAELRRKAKRRK